MLTLQFHQLETIGDFLARVVNDNDRIIRVAGYTKDPALIMGQSSAAELVVEMPIAQAVCNLG